MYLLRYSHLERSPQCRLLFQGQVRKSWRLLLQRVRHRPSHVRVPRPVRMHVHAHTHTARSHGRMHAWLDDRAAKWASRAFNQWGVRECQNPAGNVWTPINGNLVTVGETFNPFGYALVFRRVSVVGTNEAVGVAESSGSSAPTGAAATAESRAGMAGNRTLTSWHTAFSQAIIDLRARGETNDCVCVLLVSHYARARAHTHRRDGHSG